MTDEELIMTITRNSFDENSVVSHRILWQDGVAGAVFQTEDDYHHKQWTIFVFDKYLTPFIKKRGAKGCAIRKMNSMIEELLQLDCDWLNKEVPDMPRLNYSKMK